MGSLPVSEKTALTQEEAFPRREGQHHGSLELEQSTPGPSSEDNPPPSIASQSWRGWPPQIFYIMGNEACERFSFYGMRAILVIYMTEHLGMSAANAESAFHAFTAACYLLPLLGGWLADNVLGKYLVILYISFLYCLGHGVLAVWESRAGLACGLAIISIGAGGIKPCVAALVGDQFNATNKHLLPGVFSMFYWCINLGAVTAIAIIPSIMNASVSWAFSIPGLFMAIALGIFWAGRRLYVLREPKKGADKPAGFARVSSFALLHVFSRQPGQGFWDTATTRFTLEEVDAAEAVGGLLLLFICLSMYSALFDQHSSTWVIQAQEMNRNVLGWQMNPAQMQALNPVFVMVFIPIFETLIYPAVEAMGCAVTPLRKMSVGMLLTGLSFVIIALLQVALDAGGQPSILLQAPAYFVLTASEILVSITGLQFAYTQAPPSMKSTIMSLWLLTVFLGNLLDAVVTKLNFFSGAMFFGFFALLMFSVALLFIWIAASYEMRDYTDQEAGKCKQSDDGMPEDSQVLLAIEQTELHPRPS